MPSYDQPFVMVAGDDVSLAFTIYASDGETPLNLTGATISWQMRSSWDSATALISKSIGTGITVTSAVNGTFTVDLDDTDTEEMIPGRYPHAVRISDASTNDSTVTLGFGVILPKVIS